MKNKLIFNLKPINICEEEHLNKIIESINKNGYDNDYPIFYSSTHQRLITGSHRYKACEILNVEPYMIDISPQVEAWLYANPELTFDDIDFEEINDYYEDQLYNYFSHYENNYKYGECCQCGMYRDIGKDNDCCVECLFYL